MDREPVQVRIGYGENGNTWIPTYYTNAKGEPSLIGASTLGWGLPYDSSVMIEDYDGRKVLILQSKITC